MLLFETISHFDKVFFLTLNTIIANPLLDSVFLHSTNATFWIIPGIIFASIFLIKKKKEACIVLVLCITLVAITDPVATRILKPLFGRQRPCHPDFFIVGGRFISGMRTSLSFPSVHATNIFAQATLLSFFYPHLRFIFYSFAIYIGYSRIYIGVHFPADVLAGFIFGIILARIVLYVYMFIARRNAKLMVPCIERREKREER